MIISFQYEHLKVPILKIIEQPKKNQVIVAFIPFDGEHFTIHDQKDAPLITYYDKNKIMSSSDKMKVEIARKQKYKNPERHGHYIFHQNAINCMNLSGYHILDRAIWLVECYRAEKYLDNSIVWKVPCDYAMFCFYLSTENNPREFSDEFRIKTFLGTICINCKELRHQVIYHEPEIWMKIQNNILKKLSGLG